MRCPASKPTEHEHATNCRRNRSVVGHRRRDRPRTCRPGFHLVITARRRDRLDAHAAEIDATAFTLDVRERPAIEAFGAALQTQFGRVDVLVNNAGLALGREPLGKTLEDDWVRMLETEQYTSQYSNGKSLAFESRWMPRLPFRE